MTSSDKPPVLSIVGQSTKPTGKKTSKSASKESDGKESGKNAEKDNGNNSGGGSGGGLGPLFTPEPLSVIIYARLFSSIQS